MPNHDWDYLFAFGTIFAALDAYNIGANDVANSFATSVASKSLTLRQACLAAAVFEFLGAVLVGARVSGTIKNGIIAATVFQNNAGVQLLAFTCALVVSASWLMYATKKSWPVSTTYSIVSALAGVGVATGGVKSVQWGWNDGKGLATIFAGFIVAPGLAAVFAAAVFLLTKYGVLMRKDSVRAGLWASPIFFFGVTAILTMSIVYKGAPSLNLNRLTEAETAGAIIGSAGVVTVLAMIFWLPFVHARVIKHDYTVRWYHMVKGPLLWSRVPPADASVDRLAVPVYGHYKSDNPDDFLEVKPASDHAVARDPSRPAADIEASSTSDASEKNHETRKTAPAKAPLAEALVDEKTQIVGPWVLPRNLWVIVRYKIPGILLHGTAVDVHKLQAAEGSSEARRLAQMHDHANQFDNKTEHLYSFIQVMTACTASFAHGSNDVANAMGPYSAIYHIWSKNQIAGKNSDVPVWILAFGGAMIVIGLATYGYNIMRVLGNRLTPHSPSRGYSMELGASITVILASQYAIPVSTTMCITGATLGVALCNGDLRAFNWQGLGWIYLGWILTVPIAAVLAGCLMGIILNAPHF